MLSAADISSLENTGESLSNPSFPTPNGTTVWAPSFYDPFQVKHRRRTSKKQFSILEKAFNENPKPNTATRRDLAEKLKMPVRGVQVWFQNRRAKDKAQKLKMAKKNGSTSTASSPSESEKNANDDSTETSTKSSSESTSKKESSENNTEKIASSPSTVEDLKDEPKSTLDLENKLKLDKEYSLLNNPYYPMDDSISQGMVPFADPASDYFYGKQDAVLNQGFGPSSLHTDFYGGGPFAMNRRCRSNSLPNILQLTNPLNQTLPFQGLYQHPQLPGQAQPYSPQSLRFLRQTSPYSATSSPVASEKGSHPRFPIGLARHPDLFYGDIDGTGISRGRGYVNYMASPGLSDNIPSPHSAASTVYSPSYHSFIPDPASINGIRPIDDSFGYMNDPYGMVPPIMSSPYVGDIENFVPDLNAGVGFIPGLPTYPTGFKPGRRSSCPPEFFSSVNNLQLLLDEKLKKQKGLETIKEDEGIEYLHMLEEEEKEKESRKW